MAVDHTESTPLPTATKSRLRQAPVDPLDQDGVMVAALGTLTWCGATIILLLNRASLERQGTGWWLWVAVTGVVLGITGTGWCLRRKARRPRPLPAEVDPPSATAD